MLWSIRNQILIPLVVIQGVAVAAITVMTAGLAARRGEQAVIDRLNGVAETLGGASFPLSANVLARMRRLSGAHFVATSAEGRMRETSFPSGVALPSTLRDVPMATRLD